VGPQSAGADVLLLASAASVRSLVGVQSLVQFQVDKLGEFGRTQIAGVRLLAGMQPQMGLEIGRAAEPLFANVALVRFLSSVHQVVLLQVGQLGETLGADIAFEGALAGMRPQVNFQVRQLAECLVANVALVVHFSVLLLQRVRQRTVTAALASVRRRTARADGRQGSASGRCVAVQGLAVVGTERRSGGSHGRFGWVPMVPATIFPVTSG